jgi:membrane-associated protease RseP (regulator of RpoE activity)
MSDDTPQPDDTPTESSTPAEPPAAAAPPSPPTPEPAPPAPAPVAEAPADDATVPAPVAEAPTAAAAPAAPVAPVAAPETRSGIFVPKWVGILVAAVVAALVFGGIGYAIGDSSSGGSSQNASSTFPGLGNGNRPTLPNGRVPGSGPLGGSGNNGTGNNGNGNNGNGGSSNPTTGSTAFLGVQIEAAANGNGAQIADVQSGSPAATAGLQSGDVITAVDGTSVNSPAALVQAVQSHNGGDQVTITYTRNGNSATAKVTLGTRSASQNS